MQRLLTSLPFHRWYVQTAKFKIKVSKKNGNKNGEA